MGSSQLLIGLTIVLSVSLCGCSCPPNSTETFTYAGNCYRYIGTERTWMEAKEFCESSASNGVLLDIQHFSERSVIQSWLSDSVSDIWIGGYTHDFSYVSTENETQSILSTTESSQLFTTSMTHSRRGDSHHTPNPDTGPWWPVWTTAQPSVPEPAANGFLLDRSARWYWTDRQNSNTSIMLPSNWYTGHPRAGDGPCVTWFMGKFKAVNCSHPLDFICKYRCLQTIDSGELTEISSPNYPNKYDSLQNCEWDVNVGQGLAILEFVEFDTEGCNYDYLTVYESRNSTKPLATLCGIGVSNRIVSPSSTLYMRFTSDSSVTRTGFHGSVRSSSIHHTYMLEAMHGVVSTLLFPEPYINNTSTVWLISVPSGTVNLMFTELDIQPGSNNSSCDHDQLEVRENSADGQLLATLCGSELPSNITSFTGSLYLNFTTDSSVVRSGFRAIYWSSEVECFSVINSIHGFIESPRHPEYYLPNTRCVWYIDVGAGVARLNFNSLFAISTTSQNTCDQDFVEVWDGLTSNTTLVGRYCGWTSPGKLRSKSRYMTIFFESNSYSQARGFHATFRSSTNCAHALRRPIGNISSPDFPSYYEALTNCTWVIDVLSGNATLKLQTFDFQHSFGCEHDRFEVHDGNSPLAPQVAGSPFCGSSLPDVIVGSSQYLFIRMYTNSDSSIALGFTGDYWSSDYRCHMWGSEVESFSYKDKCYGFVRSTKSWLDARSYCESKGTSLFYIESRAEYESIRKTIYERGPAFSSVVWTGGHRRVVSSDDWYWSTSQEDIAFIQSNSGALWKYSEPDLSDRYVYMSSTGLGATSVYGSYAFLCKESPRSSIPGSAFRGSCSPPPSIHYGYYTPVHQFYNQSSVITFVCDHDHSLQGSANLICVNGTWGPQIPICEESPSNVSESSCLVPPSVANGHLDPLRSVYPNGTSVIIQCNTGYYAADTDKKLVCVNQHWQGVVPVCLKTSTGKSDAQQSGDDKTSEKDYTTILSVTVTIIALLTVIIVVGVVWTIIHRRKASQISNQRLVEMR